MKTTKKLIEVALPLEAINTASVLEKQPFTRKHPRSIHIWWARRPLVSARAVIFSQLVDDPSEYIDELLADHSLRNQAEKIYHSQLRAWEARKNTFDKAQIAGMSENANPDPGPQPTIENIISGLERDRLFHIIEELVLWENTSNEAVLNKARAEISKSWKRTCAQNSNHPRSKELFNPEILPAFHDPFAGGGALPLEAQRLGLESYGSDLNPVAVLINKAMIEIPSKFAGISPINPKSNAEMHLIKRAWQGVNGLIDDIRYYGEWLRDEAEKEVGHLYPDIEITTEMVKDRPDLNKYLGQKLSVTACLWARTVKSPNPAYTHVDVPLISTFLLYNKPGKETYIEPVIENGDYSFKIRVGKPNSQEVVESGTKLNRANFVCLMSGTPIPGNYIKMEGKAGRMGVRLIAIVAEGKRERVYLPPTKFMDLISQKADPVWKPEGDIPARLTGGTCVPYGLISWGDIFTNRQLVTLTTLSSLVLSLHEKVRHDAIKRGFIDDGKGLSQGGNAASAYADAVAIYISLAISRWADLSNSLCSWNNTNQNARALFARQAIPMTWDFVELSPFSKVGPWFSTVESTLEAMGSLAPGSLGVATQVDASVQSISQDKIISTDPPYYDNIGYADLSDFFYVWLRKSLKTIIPDLFTTMAVPKTEELVATAYRHGGKEKAELFFLEGMTRAMHRIKEQSHPGIPVTIYYAFKQAESDNEGTASTGWDTFLDAIITAGFTITGTWPMRTERGARSVGLGTNALASSIILVCRKQQNDASNATRREFINALKTELPKALTQLQAGNIAPVDLAQAAIGPGMAVYTRYAKVLDAQGKPITVKQALTLINQTLDESLAEQEGDFDADTRWALAWFEQNGFSEGEYGVAETLSKAKDTSVNGMVDAGILSSGRGKVRLLQPAELPSDWDPIKDTRLTAWEMVHQLIRVLESEGESAAAALESKLGVQAETARELCYRLYTICERKKRSSEALSYNALVQSWPEITRLARENFKPTETQATLF